jgi:predicted ATPase
MRCVLTGHSGSGKSTLIKLLAESGVFTLPEVARPILEKNRIQSHEFQQVQMMYQQWKNEIDRERFLSDRGLHDYIVFSRRVGLTLPFYSQQAMFRYNMVLKMPNRDFAPDGVRVEHDLSEAIEIQQEVDDLYKQTGHRIIEIPDEDKLKQVKFVRTLLQYT